ncbi:MAG: cytochrome c3 family protein [Bacteroidales bacterium]
MTRFKKRLAIILAAHFALLLFLLGYYSYWTALPPDRTCMSCHEIEASYNMWAGSAHRDINCIECHGTALSNGIHSMKEKSRMVFRHFSREYYDDISLTEQQVIDMNQTCRSCHQAEYAAWQSGGHSVDYAHIFLDHEQNSNEQLNHDCLRCHGMFYEGDIHSLVEPVDIQGPWSLSNPDKAHQPAIPCLACHQVHGDGLPKAGIEYAGSSDVHYARKPGYSKAGLYDRNERKFINADHLSKPVMWDGERQLRVSDDPLMRMCIQCHAPSAWHQAGTIDDRTPSGVHEGISCLSCHNSHSNSAVNACVSCHPGVSNCGLDVMTMNTSYAFKGSPNNIHSVSCADCHDGIRPEQKLLTE